jgi:FkbM family methyltransferase
VIKRVLKSLLGVLHLRLQRQPSHADLEKRKSAVMGLKYGWLRKYGIQKIVDIGANDGHFALEISCVFKTEPLYCFEPLPDIFTALQRSLVGRPNVTFFNFALGEIEGDLQMYQNAYSPSSSILEMADMHKEIFRFTKNATLLKIPVRRLDSMVSDIQPDKCTLLKIDVQGYEAMVIKGGLEFISRCKALIVELSFEPLYKGQSNFHNLYTQLYELGFEYHGNVDQLCNPHNGELLQADGLFVNRNL